VVDYDGSTNAGQRQAVGSDGPKKKKPALKKKYDGKTFGTQADMPRKISVFIFGDTNGDQTMKIVLNGSIKTFDQVMKKLPVTGQGPAGKLLAQDYRSTINKLEKFKDGGQYLAVIKGQKIAKNADGSYVSKGIPKTFLYVAKEKDTGVSYSDVKAKYPNVTKADCAACVEQFNIYDANGDEKIDQDEITSSMVQLGIDMTEGEAEVILQKYDADNSGALDIMEYIGVFADYKKQDGSVGAVGNAASEACVVM